MEKMTGKKERKSGKEGKGKRTWKDGRREKNERKEGEVLFGHLELFQFVGINS